jgi:uncharacterized protein YbjT (DUF2867 family)
MELSTLTQPRPIKTTADLFGDPVTLTYDRIRIDQQFWAFQTWREQLAYVLISWDVTKMGVPYLPPESGDRFKEWLKLFEPIPDFTLRPVLDHILDEWRGGPKAAAGSTST